MGMYDEGQLVSFGWQGELHYGVVQATRGSDTFLVSPTVEGLVVMPTDSLVPVENTVHPEGHLAGHDFPCNDCGARWQPSAIEDDAWVIVHHSGCAYFSPGLDENEHVVGWADPDNPSYSVAHDHDDGNATIKVLAGVLGWIAALVFLMSAVWGAAHRDDMQHKDACHVVARSQLVGRDYHGGAFWDRTSGRLVAFAPTEDSTATTCG